MRKHLAKRILCLCLAASLTAANILPAIAAKRADVYGSGNLADYTFENGASVAALNPNGACTGLAWEETDVKPLTGYVELDDSFWYGKHWASAKKPVTAAVSLKGEESTKISVDFRYNICILALMPIIIDINR